MDKKERLMAKLQQLGGCDKCRRCGKSAYANERVTIEKQFYHLNCITCVKCGANSDTNKVKTIKEELYCPDCYARLSGSKKELQELDDIRCRRCGNSANCTSERVTIGLQFYHLSCIICANCGAKGDVGTMTPEDNELYCPRCRTRCNPHCFGRRRRSPRCSSTVEEPRTRGKRARPIKATKGVARSIESADGVTREAAQDTAEESPSDPKEAQLAEAVETKGVAGSTEPADGVISEDDQGTGTPGPSDPEKADPGDGDEAEAQGAPGSGEQADAAATDGQDVETKETAGDKDLGAEESGTTGEADA